MSDQPRQPPGNIIQAGGQVATDIVGSLKGNPILLLLVLFNAGFIAFVYFTARDTRERQGEMIKHLLTNQATMQEMLSRCVVPGRGGIEWPNVTGWPPPAS